MSEADKEGGLLAADYPLLMDEAERQRRLLCALMPFMDLEDLAFLQFLQSAPVPFVPSPSQMLTVFWQGRGTGRSSGLFFALLRKAFRIQHSGWLWFRDHRSAMNQEWASLIEYHLPQVMPSFTAKCYPALGWRIGVLVFIRRSEQGKVSTA